MLPPPFPLAAQQSRAPCKACAVALPLPLLISREAVQKCHPPNSASPTSKYPQRPRTALSLHTGPGPVGVSTREKNIREETPASIFHCQWGTAGTGHRVLSLLAVPWQNPQHSLLSSHLSICITILGLWGEGPQFLSLGRYLETTQACRIKAGMRQGGPEWRLLL